MTSIALFGLNHGAYFGFDGAGTVWFTTVVLTIALYLSVRGFARLKARRRDIAWLEYL